MYIADPKLAYRKIIVDGFPASPIKDKIRISTDIGLRTINGIGLRLQGTLFSNDIPNFHYTIYWLVFFFIPVFPLGIFIVRGTKLPHSTLQIIGSVGFRAFLTRYGFRFFILIFTSYIETFIILAITVTLLFLVSVTIHAIF